jgi:hypothetical protein
MLLLPVANPLGVLGIPEIVLVRGLGQPGPLRLALAGLAAVGFMAVTLAWPTPIIRKKKFLAVQALASATRRLHRFQSQKEPVSEDRAKQRKKIQPEQNSGRGRRKKSFQRIFRRKPKGRRSISWLPVLHLFDFTGGSLADCRMLCGRSHPRAGVSDRRSRCRPWAAPSPGGPVVHPVGAKVRPSRLR